MEPTIAVALGLTIAILAFNRVWAFAHHVADVMAGVEAEKFRD